MTRPFIETRATRFKERDEEKHRARVNTMLVGKGFRAVQDWTPLDTAVSARVHRGAWIADCPLSLCQGAQYADPDWPFFVCTSGCGTGPYPVRFPSEREEIEAELVKRPVLATRGWFPHETVADLRRENAAHAAEMRVK